MTADAASKELLAGLREKVQAKLAQRAASAPPAVTPVPRYDDVFAAGMEWLDALAGEPVESTAGVLTVAPGDWEALTRTASDLR